MKLKPDYLKKKLYTLEKFDFGKIDRITEFYSNVVRKMDLALESYIAQDINSIEPDDIPKTNNPVWILGRSYSAVQGNIFSIISTIS